MLGLCFQHGQSVSRRQRDLTVARLLSLNDRLPVLHVLATGSVVPVRQQLHLPVDLHMLIYSNGCDA